MERFQYLLGSQSKKQQLCSWEIVWPQPRQLQAPGICLKVCFYLAKQQSEGKQENPQLNTGIFVINWNMSCVDTHMHTWRFLLSQEFNNQTKGRAAQKALPSWCFRAGHCAGPSAHALENFKGMEEWESTDTGQSSEQSLPTSTAQKRSCYPTGTAGHGTARPEALQAILIHSSSQSHSFLVFSEDLSSQMGPKGYNSTSFPITDKLSKYCTSFQPLLNFCNCLPTWFLVSFLHSNYKAAPLPGKPHPKHIPSLIAILRHPWLNYFC